MLNHPTNDGRSWRKTAAKIATRTTLNLDMLDNQPQLGQAKGQAKGTGTGKGDSIQYAILSDGLEIRPTKSATVPSRRSHPQTASLHRLSSVAP